MSSDATTYGAEYGADYGSEEHHAEGPYHCGTLEECIDNDNNNNQYTYWYVARGVFTTWMMVLGGLIYSWYPSLIYNNAWWRA